MEIQTLDEKLRERGVKNLHDRVQRARRVVSELLAESRTSEKRVRFSDGTSANDCITPSANGGTWMSGVFCRLFDLLQQAGAEYAGQCEVDAFMRQVEELQGQVEALQEGLSD